MRSRIRLSGMVLFIFGTLILSGCASLEKMKKEAYKIKYTVTPQVLETNAGNVSYDIQGTIPQKYFLKKATVAAKPVLRYEGGEKDFAPVMLQGESVKDNNKVISYANGGNFSTKNVFPFEKAMRKSELVMKLHATKGKKALDFDPVKIADGVLATSTLVDNSPLTILGIQKRKNTTGVYDPTIDKYQRVVPDKYEADLIYLINSAVVRPQELTKEEMQRLDKYIYDAYKGNQMQLKGVEISAYASPDGPLALNTKLSENRQQTSTKALENTFKKEEIKTDIKAKYTPEDWDGFKMLMEKSNIQDKDLILRVLSMYSDPEVRNREMHKLSKVFEVVAKEILPQLRRSKITATVDLIGKTDEEILSLALSDPSKLNQAELLYAATLTKDPEKQKTIYTSFTKIFTDDWRGFNNLGAVIFKMGEVDAAGSDFEKADKLDPKNAIVQNNLGCVALKKNELSKAEVLFGAASGAGKEVDNNLGIVKIMQGQYDTANKYFAGEVLNPANKALAQMLTGDNNGALQTLNNAPEKTALTDYLKAVIGARTANTSIMYESLGSAVKKDPSYKSLAKTDLEFAKYFNDQNFKSLVQ
jgi:tetratricopeptide (TPR) repeat protein